jgi:mannose-1-phosphate guanylyltransferase/phosphomannomutase
VKRALISGVTSTGVHVTDLRLAPASLNRHLLGSGEYAAGVHVRTSDADPEVVEIQVFEASGVQMGATLEKELTKHFARQEFRRATYSEIGGLAYASRATEMYEQDLLAALDAEAIRRRRFRVFVDYCHAPTALLLPGILGALGVEAISVQADVTERLPASPSALRDAGLARARGLVPAVGADLGAIVDHGGERVAIVGEDGHEIPAELLLLAVVALLARRGGAGTIAVPVTTTHAVERIVAGSRLEVKRTRVSLAALTSAAAQPRVVFAGAADGSFVFPRFLPAPAATSTVAFLLGLLAGEERSLSSLVAALPTPEVTHRRLRCPWALKGTLMRVLAERTKGRETDVTDGLKVMDERGWYQVIPDPAEPVVHVYVEGETPTDAERLELEITGLVEDVLEGDGGVPVPAVADIDPAA